MAELDSSYFYKILKFEVLTTVLVNKKDLLAVMRLIQYFVCT
jgi:hypothetical protein